MQDEGGRHRGATALRQGLTLVLGLAAAWSAWALLSDLRQILEVRWRWERFPAAVANQADRHWVELEVDEALDPTLGQVPRPQFQGANREGTTRILAPQRTWAGYDLFQPVEVARDPADASRVAIVDWQADLWPNLARLVAMALPLAGWLLLRRLRWGEDLTWSNGEWVATESQALRPGLLAPALHEIEEDRSSRKAVVFWTTLFGLIVAGLGTGMVLNRDALDFDAVYGGAAALLVFSLAAYAALKTFSRRVRFDDTGVCDTHFFGTRRVAYASVADIGSVNLAESEQRRYDQARIGSSLREGFRPSSLPVWIARDAQGRELLRFSESMSPPDVFAELRRRLAGKAHGASPAATSSSAFAASSSAAASAAATNFAHAGRAMPSSVGSNANANAEPDMERLLSSMPEFAAAQAPSGGRRTGLVLGLLAMLLPFALGAGWATWRTLWFQFAAEQAVGTVLSNTGGEAPQVTVAYTPKGASAPLQIRSDGSTAYADIRVGSTIRVFHDRDDPEFARLDLFLEQWLWPIIAGVFLAIAGLLALLIWRSMTRPMVPAWAMRPPRPPGR